MKKYEYRIVGIKCLNGVELNSFFNELGAEGWKLCGGNVDYKEDKPLPYQINMGVFRRKLPK